MLHRLALASFNPLAAPGAVCHREAPGGLCDCVWAAQQWFNAEVTVCVFVLVFWHQNEDNFSEFTIKSRTVCTNVSGSSNLFC